MVESADIALGQAIAVTNARPAVGSVHELIAESEFQAGMLAQSRKDVTTPSRAASCSRIPIA